MRYPIFSFKSFFKLLLGYGLFACCVAFYLLFCQPFRFWHLLVGAVVANPFLWFYLLHRNGTFSPPSIALPSVPPPLPPSMVAKSRVTLGGITVLCVSILLISMLLGKAMTETGIGIGFFAAGAVFLFAAHFFYATKRPIPRRYSEAIEYEKYPSAHTSSIIVFCLFGVLFLGVGSFVLLFIFLS